jgi:hypothetical protein
MKYQRGMSLNVLMMGGAILFLVALLGMKVAPPWMEYGKIVKIVKATAQDTGLRDATVAEIRKAYDKRADIDAVSAVRGVDLDITKDGNELLIEFAYSSKIPLFKYTSILFEFEGSSTAQ